MQNHFYQLPPPHLQSQHLSIQRVENERNVLFENLLTNNEEIRMVQQQELNAHPQNQFVN